MAGDEVGANPPSQFAALDQLEFAPPPVHTVWLQPDWAMKTSSGTQVHGHRWGGCRLQHDGEA